MNIVLVYADGREQVKDINKDAYRIYGGKLDGLRPVNVIMPKGMSKEFVKSMEQMMHPIDGKITYK